MVVTSLAIFGPPVSAQEVCGLQSAVYDVIFANGFQAASGTLGNALGTVPSPTIGTTPTIVITYPAASAQLPANHTAVAGTFTGPDHTGITVNGKTGTPTTTVSWFLMSRWMPAISRCKRPPRHWMS